MQPFPIAKLSIAAIGASAALGFAGAAGAGPAIAAADAPDAIVLKATDADLHTEKGARALAFRIRIAAANVCGADVDPIVRSGEGFYRCEAAAIDGAIKSADAPLLAQALGRTQRQLAGMAR